MQSPDNIRYSESHEWSSLDDDIVTIGISDHAQDQLGDLVFVELPEVGNTVDAGDQIATLESVKTAVDIYAPVSGEIMEINDVLTDSPELINQSPFADGWLCKIRVVDGSEYEQLLDADQYQQLLD